MREMIDAGISLKEILTKVEADYNEAAALKQKEEKEFETRRKNIELAEAREMYAEAMLHYFDVLGMKDVFNVDREDIVDIIKESEQALSLFNFMEMGKLFGTKQEKQEKEKEDVIVSMPYDDFFEALDKAGLM